MALRSGIEPPSPHRQCGRLIQMRNGAMSMIRKSGNRFSLATNAERVCAEIMLKQEKDLVRSAGVEPAWSPTALSRRRVYQFRHERGLNWRTWSDSNRRCFRNGLRIRSLGRWGYRSMIGGSGWFRTTCARVKNPLHLHSGLTLRIHRLSGPPVMNRTSVDRLSSDCSATELREAMDGA